MIIKCNTNNVTEINDMLKYFKTSISKEYMEDNPFIFYLGYESNNELIGFVSFSVLYERAELNYVYVKPEYRDGLVATSLLEEMFKICFEKGVKSITLEVRESNKAAIKLYEKTGFTSIAKRDRYYNDEDGLLMEKVIE